MKNGWFKKGWFTRLIETPAEMPIGFFVVIYLGFGVELLWKLGGEWLLSSIPRSPEEIALELVRREIIKQSSVLTLVTMMMKVAFVEELQFRLFPLGAMIFASSRWKKVPLYVFLIVILFVSLYFGSTHTRDSVRALSLQGFAGAIYGLVFLKVSGMRLELLPRAFLAAVLIHMQWNIFEYTLVKYYG